MTDQQARELAARLEDRLEALSPAATDTIATLLELYGEGLARIVARVPAEALAEDEVIAHLLLVHGLHPVPLEQRVEGALDEVRPYLRTHGGEVDLLEVREGIVRLRLQGSCSGCPSSRTTLELAVAEAIRNAAPEVEAVEAEDVPVASAAYDTCPLPMAPGGAR